MPDDARLRGAHAERTRVKAWTRTRSARRCGLCGQTIAIGEPVLTRELPGRNWRSVRCATCAGELVPDLPPLQPLPRAERMTPIPTLVPVARLARDWKRAAAEREPGEEG